MRFFGRDVEGYPKIVLVLVAILLVASGLCGLQMNVSGGVQSPFLSVVFIALGTIELGAMLVSAVGLVVVLLAWAATSLYGRFSSPSKGETIHLFDGSDKDAKSDEKDNEDFKT